MKDFENLLKADIALEERMLKMIQQELRTLPAGRLKLGNRGKSIYDMTATLRVLVYCLFIRQTKFIAPLGVCHIRRVAC